MTALILTTRDGTTHLLEGADGVSLMEAIRAHGHHELLALCGGNCSCGTCHVQVEATWFERLLKISDDEKYLLDLSAHRIATSRLSCQVVIEPGLAGLAARIAPEDL